MKRLRVGLVLLAILGTLAIVMAIQMGRDRAHQMPLGRQTMGTSRP